MRVAKYTNLLLFVVTVCSFISCRESYVNQTLKQADNIMETEPAKALELLSGLKPDDFSRDELAYYSLLYTQAQIKCNLKISSDSLILNAVKRYSDSNTGNRKIRAYFYWAYTRYYSKLPHDAMKYTLEAYELAKENKDYYWIAKSAEFISDIFFESYNYKEAEKYTQEAIKNFALANRITNQRYSLCDLATIYLNQNKNDRAIALLDSLLNICEKETPTNLELIDYIKQPLFETFVKIGRYDEAERLNYDVFSHTETNAEKIAAAIVMCAVQRQSENYDIDNTVLEEVKPLIYTNEEKTHVLYAEYLNLKAQGFYTHALAVADSLLFLQGAMAEELLEESVTGAQRDFYSLRAIRQERKSNWLAKMLYAVILVSIIIISLIWTIYRLNLRAKKTELEANLSSFLNLKANFDSISDENVKLTIAVKEKNIEVEQLTRTVEHNRMTQNRHADVLEHLFKERWNTLNMLCNEYFDMGGSEKTRNSILNNIEEELKKLRSKKGLEQIEKAVDNYMGGIMTRLRQECPFLKENDYVFMSLVFAGFSVRAVCMFTDIKYKLYYLKKSRLSKRISESDAPSKALFLVKMS